MTDESAKDGFPFPSSLTEKLRLQHTSPSSTISSQYLCSWPILTWRFAASLILSSFLDIRPPLLDIARTVSNSCASDYHKKNIQEFKIQTLLANCKRFVFILLRRTTRTLFTNVGLCSWVRHFSLTVLSTPRSITAQIQEARRRESLETRSSKVRGNWGEMTSRWRLPPSYLNFIVIHERLLTALCLTRCFVCIIPLL